MTIPGSDFVHSPFPMKVVTMRKASILIAAALALGLASTQASATTFKFAVNYAGQQVGTGVIEATQLPGSASYLASSITGRYRNFKILGLTAPDATLGNDNLLTPSQTPPVTSGGFAFTYGVATTDVRAERLSAIGDRVAGDSFHTYVDSFTLTPVATPEAAGFGVLGLGVAGLALARRRRTVTS